MTSSGSKLAVTAALILACFVVGARAQNNIDFTSIEIQTVKLADGLYVLMGGPGAGIVASVGSDGIFLGGAITPDRFVGLVYTDLSRKKTGGLSSEKLFSAISARSALNVVPC